MRDHGDSCAASDFCITTVEDEVAVAVEGEVTVEGEESRLTAEDGSFVAGTSGREGLSASFKNRDADEEATQHLNRSVNHHHEAQNLHTSLRSRRNGRVFRNRDSNESHRRIRNDGRNRTEI